MTKFKQIMNKVHSILTTGKAAAAGVGAFLTSVGASLALTWGAESPVIISVVAVGTVLTQFSVWEIPYTPFVVKDEE